MIRLPAAYPVDTKAALAWLQGKESTADPDLLDWTVDRSDWLYIARMHSRSEWPIVAAAIKAFTVKNVIYRSRCPGLIRLAQKAGGTIPYVEPEGGFRIHFTGEAFDFTFARLTSLYGRLKKSI